MTGRLIINPRWSYVICSLLSNISEVIKTRRMKRAERVTLRNAYTFLIENPSRRDHLGFLHIQLTLEQ